MNEAARRALEKLLRSAENSQGKLLSDDNEEAISRSIQLRFTESSFPTYRQFQTHAEKAACNNSLRLAERDGAINIEWDSRAGKYEHIDLIRLTNR